MKILICCATQKELKVVKEEIKSLHLKIQLPIEYLCTGMGNHQTIFALTKFLEEKKDEKYFIVNIGVCGYSPRQSKNLDESTGSFTSFKMTRIQGAIVEHIQIQKEQIVPIFFTFAPLKKIISSEIPVDDEHMLAHWEDEEVFVDMESYGVELVAQQFQYPRLILKVPIDKVGAETKQFDFETALMKLKENIDYKKLIEDILKYIEDVKK